MPRKSRRGGPRPGSGPKPDNEGHRRVAELLANKPWSADLKATCELLAAPPDGKPGPKISLRWRKKYGITSYAEAPEKIPPHEVWRHIERRIYLGKCLNGTIVHRATRPEIFATRTYGRRGLRRVMTSFIVNHPTDTAKREELRNAWREVIREGLFEGWIAWTAPAYNADRLDLIESVARETLQHRTTKAYVRAWRITDELISQCERVLQLLAPIPMTVRHPERRATEQQVIDWLYEFTGSITGRVTDAAGNPVVGALIRLTSGGSKRARETTRSYAQGVFFFPALPIACYELHVTMPYFEPAYREDVRVMKGESASIDIQLERRVRTRRRTSVAPRGVLAF